ncbi:hypothetical protein EJ04DRAFT_515848 [Polyplosphaeria fusca]|uniref:Uncharacterized protein n=1 Tax=Polyplosphaeria fusca TaxID=682080 RepID=A0A9P4QRE2_9PLEO|nr:hypothetical protein EJ04DRAFT_515848 [Polyplosphaeria fusca]
MTPHLHINLRSLVANAKRVQDRRQGPKTGWGSQRRPPTCDNDITSHVAAPPHAYIQSAMYLSQPSSASHIPIHKPPPQSFPIPTTPNPFQFQNLSSSCPAPSPKKKPNSNNSNNNTSTPAR